LWALGLAFYGCSLRAGDDPDPSKVLNEARTLARQGKYEEALQKHIWFHENALKYDRSLTGVRLSFALADWVELGKKYPKAREALVAIRDKDTKAVRDGDGSFDLFRDVKGINWALGEGPKTAELFKTLHEKQPDLAKQCYLAAEEELVASREYQLCGAYVPDPIRRLDSIKRKRVTELQLAKDDDTPLKRYAEESFVEETCRLIDILVGSGRKQEAETVRERALAVRDDPAIRQAVEKAAERQKTRDQ
jgi:hypothetical protein